MSDRTLRRAAEHKARKLAARQQKQQQQQPQTAPSVDTTQPEPQLQVQPQVQLEVMTASAGAGTPAPSILNPGLTDHTTDQSESTTDSHTNREPNNRQPTEAQLTANRANAQKSTGPITAQGRATSSLNAVKTGLTGQTVLLPTDDAIAYQAHLGRHFKQHAPATDEEHTLVQMLADAEWRILRIPGLEASIYAIGRRKLADLYPDETDPAVRQSLITGEVLLAYRRDLTNLGLQERRLRNQHKADLEKLKALQDERLEKKDEKGKIQARMTEAVKNMRSALKVWGKFCPAEFGFEFSLAEIEYCDEIAQSAYRAGHQSPCFADLLNSYRSSDQYEKRAA